MRFLFLLFFVFSINITCICQLPFGLVDSRNLAVCSSCEKVIENKPKEALFGIHILSNGDVLFLMDDIKTFHKIFVDNSYGVTADIISKDRYKCGNSNISLALPKGLMLNPVYKADITNNSINSTSNSIAVKIGSLPSNLLNKELEGNLVIVKDKHICYYSNFVDIDRSDWSILSMGFFTDSLINYDFNATDNNLANTKKINIEIPFSRNSFSINKTSLKRVFDSLKVDTYNIKNIDIKTYASVEGDYFINENLSKKRTKAVKDFIQNNINQKVPIFNSINENWVEFFEKVDEQEIELFYGLNKKEVKVKFLDEKIKDSFEYILEKQRKSVVSFVVTNYSEKPLINKDNLLDKLQQSITNRKINEALLLQKNIAVLINDNELPAQYLNKIEVPKEREFSSLMNDNVMYRLLLKSSNEYEALTKLREAYEIDSSNGKLNYNIAALEFFIWSNDDIDSTSGPSILHKLKKLQALGIDSSLVKRMWINYYILSSRSAYNKSNFDEKDSLVMLIRDAYTGIIANDVDILRLAKFYNYYSFANFSLDVVSPRATSIDVSEDLVFYYLNLLFFYPSQYSSAAFEKAMLNAININRPRFCKFFKSHSYGGASMQLLDDSVIFTKYCESCNK